MSRKAIIILVTAACLLTVFLVWAQDITNIHDLVNNANDYEAVRKVVRKEIQGWFKNDPEQVFSVFDTDNFIGISAGGSDDPKEWTVSASGRADVRAYADRVKNAMQNIPEGYQHRAEIQHVHIKGNHALAVARQWMHTPEEEKNRTVDVDFQTVWMLKKSGGQWKIIGYIGGVVAERVVTEN